MTNIYSPHIQNFKIAKDLITRWELVVFPTETVYWLWANALDQDAVRKIFKTKNRPADNPLIVHLALKSDIKKYAIISHSLQKLIINKLMPWPITIVLPKRSIIPDIVTAWSPMVAIRLPQNDIAQDFLKIVNLPIVAPSANLSTQASPTSADMVYKSLGSRVPMIIDWWICDFGIESTVVMIPDDKHIKILRPWIITKQDLQELCPQDVKISFAQKPSEHSPGNKYKHYSPQAQVFLFSNIQDILSYDQSSQKIWLIATQEFISTNFKSLSNLVNLTIYDRWTKSNLVTCAQNLFQLYHQCDQDKIDIILIQSLPPRWIWYSIMNRVRKSLSNPKLF